MIELKQIQKREKVLYFINVRQTGKTTLLKQGIDNYNKPFYLVCVTFSSGERLTNNPNAIIITSDNCEKLLDRNIPIIYDQEFLLHQFHKIQNELWNELTNITAKIKYGTK